MSRSFSPPRLALTHDGKQTNRPIFPCRERLLRLDFRLLGSSRKRGRKGRKDWPSTHPARSSFGNGATKGFEGGVLQRDGRGPPGHHLLPAFANPTSPPLLRGFRFPPPGWAAMGWRGRPMGTVFFAALGFLAFLLQPLGVGGAAPQDTAWLRPGGAAPLFVNISLDSPPERRWVPVLRHFDRAFLREACARIIEETIPKWVHAVIRPIAKEIESFVPQPFAGEIRGLCKALKLNVGDGLLLNLAYESTAFCTSIIAQDNDGHIYHGRNMDYLFGDILRKITIEVDFLKNGKVKYRGTTFLGYVGLWTGQSPYKFTISGNERDKGKWWENAIAAFLNRDSPVSWLTRTVLNEAEDFESAAFLLSKTPIIADVYYIVGGVTPKEGVVITRKRRGPVDIWPLDPLSGGWYRVETNYDHWTTPPPFDDRRTPAIKALNATGQENINLESLYKILSVRPVLNKDTIYTTVMSAATPDKYMTQIRTLE